jgi:hypothetical protein
LPLIYIIVNGAHVTLVGVADNATDKNIAGLRANGVPRHETAISNTVVDSR